MAKKETQEEVPQESQQESSLATPGSAFDFLLQGMVETEVEQKQTFKLPTLHVFMPGKKFADRGAIQGFVIDKPDGAEVNLTQLRLVRLDAPVMQRLMWEFDVQTGKRLQQADPKPACASSDGISARKADVFGYIGKEYVDWRDGENVTILPDNCKDCPLGQWKETFGGPDWNLPVMEENNKGIAYTKRSAPPCQELPAYVFYDLDRKMLLLFQAPNFTTAAFLMGSNGRYNKRFGGVLKGVEEFYYTAQGTKRPDVSPSDGVMLPLMFATKMVNNAPYGMTPAPVFALGEPLTEQEIAEYATAIQLYRSDNLRSLISGEFWGVQENLTPAVEEAVAPSPW